MKSNASPGRQELDAEGGHGSHDPISLPQFKVSSAFPFLLLLQFNLEHLVASGTVEELTRHETARISATSKLSSIPLYALALAILPWQSRRYKVITVHQNKSQNQPRRASSFTLTFNFPRTDNQRLSVKPPVSCIASRCFALHCPTLLNHHLCAPALRNLDTTRCASVVYTQGQSPGTWIPQAQATPTAARRRRRRGHSGSQIHGHCRSRNAPLVKPTVPGLPNIIQILRTFHSLFLHTDASHRNPTRSHLTRNSPHSIVLSKDLLRWRTVPPISALS